MSFLEKNIITEIHLKNLSSPIFYKSQILKNYPTQQQTEIKEEQQFIFNLVKLETKPFAGLALYLRTRINETPDGFDIEEKYIGFIIASDISVLRLMDNDDLNDADKKLLLVEGTEI